MNSLCPLDHLYISQVKRSNFLYPLSIMTKRRRNCGDFVVSFFKILYDRGRNTCLYKGEMCFILLGGVLTSLFLYTGLVIMLHTLCLSLIYIYMMMYAFFTYFTCVVSFLSLCTCFLLLVCNLLFLFHTKMP